MAAAVINALRKHGLAPGPEPAAGSQATPGRLADRVFVLCRWRDQLARQQDESAHTGSTYPPNNYSQLKSTYAAGPRTASQVHVLTGCSLQVPNG